MATITYHIEQDIASEAFVDVLRRSTLDQRRPVDNPAAVENMIRHANLVVTARRGDELIGVARSLTDFSFCCYLSDLAVDASVQRLGVGRELLRQTEKALEPGCKLILLAAPAAEEYYPKVGFSRHESCWVRTVTEGGSDD